MSDPWQRLKARLKDREEGDVLHAYQDSRGFWTIGVGHLIDPRMGGALPAAVLARFPLPNPITSAYTIDQAAADEILDGDVAKFATQIDANLPWWRHLDQVRREVLLDMEFNMGWSNLAQFKNTLAAVQRGDYAAAAAGMRASLWEKQVGDRVDKILAPAMATGVFPA